ncbi:MFS general substrate transporter [Serendipita vermifera]|nr:MFS general substrate transporter [Serendipita vermifera]
MSTDPAHPPVSSPNGADEQTPLLRPNDRHDEREEPQLDSSNGLIARISEGLGVTPTLIQVLPVLFLFYLALALPDLTIVDIMKRLLCGLWYLRNKPEEIPEDGPIPDEKCDIPGPVALFSSFLMIQSILQSLGGFIVTSLIAQLGARVGRKPVLLVLLLSQIVTLSFFMAALFMDNLIAALVLLILWLVSSSITGLQSVMIMANLMVIDTATPSSRMASLSFTIGAVYAGQVPSYAIGGYLDRTLGHKALFIFTIAVSVINLLYASSGAVKETFGGAKREAAWQERVERRARNRERSLERWNASEGDSTRGIRRVFRKTGEGMMTVIEPILRLKPFKKDNGSWNLRLTILGLVYTCASLGIGYIGPALIAFGTVILRHDPQKNGITMTMITAAQLLGLMVIFPLISKWGIVLYTKIHGRGHKLNGVGPLGPIHSEEREALVGEDERSDPCSDFSTAHFDVYLLRFCYAFGAAFLFCVGFVRTDAQLWPLIMFTSLMSGAHPALQSIVAATVQPILSGEAVAGIEMVGHVARLGSPMLIGALQSKTLLTMPTLSFLVMAALVTMGFLLTFLVRDEDRYRPPRVQENGATHTEEQ